MEKSRYSILIIFLFATSLLIGCNRVKEEEAKHEQAENEMEHMESDEHASEQEHSDADNSHEGGDMEMSDEGAMIWKPGDDANNLITKDFHFIAGALENILPEVIQDGAGNNALKLTLDGTTTSFVFHQTFGNVGMAANIYTKDFDGTLKLIHHAIDNENYEFVSITGNSMKLGRIVDGTEEVFDEKSYDAGDWFDLRVSAAGTHFKGYVGDETITHGHGDKMKDGYVGIMLDGTGSIQIKSIELFRLEDE